VNPSDSPYPRRGPCPKCSGTVLPDGVCINCFNRRRSAVILRLFASGPVIGLLVIAAVPFFPRLPDTQGLIGAIRLIMFFSSIIGGLITGGLYSWIVPEERRLEEVKPMRSDRECPNCQRLMVREEPPWCSRCSGIRLRKLMVALGVGLPLLGIGACDALFSGIGEALFRMNPLFSSWLTNLAIACASGPLAAGLVWEFFSRAAWRRKGE